MNEEININLESKLEKEIHKPKETVTVVENSNDAEFGENATWSKHQNWIQKIGLSISKSFRICKSYVLSNEDDIVFQCTSNKVSTPKENSNLLTELTTISDSNITIVKNKCLVSSTTTESNMAQSIASPSTSNSNKNNFSFEMKKSECNTGTQINNIDLDKIRSVLSDSDEDNDSIVVAYLKDKDSLTNLGNLSIPKKLSVLEKVPKMETIREGAQFAAFPDSPSSSHISTSSEQLSETSLDVYIPSYPGSPRSLNIASENSSLSLENPFIEAVEYLHEDKEFLIAAEIGNVKIIDILLSKGADIQQMDHLGRNALHLAVCSDSEAAVVLLLKAGIKPNVKDNLGMTPLSLCLMRRPSYKIANLLFNYGAEIVPRSNPVDTGLFLQFVMMCVPTDEESQILKLLVNKGALVNDPDAPGGRQPMHFAAMSNNCRLIHILANLGADLTVTNHRNETPKDVAMIFKCKEAYELLSDLEDEEYSTVCLSNN